MRTFPLVPFGSLNYVGPLWWSEHARGLFPLVRFGESSYVGPLWWRNDAPADASSGGLFPLALFGPSDFSCIASTCSCSMRNYGRPKKLM